MSPAAQIWAPLPPKAQSGEGSKRWALAKFWPKKWEVPALAKGPRVLNEKDPFQSLAIVMFLYILDLHVGLIAI